MYQTFYFLMHKLFFLLNPPYHNIIIINLVLSGFRQLWWQSLVMDHLSAFTLVSTNYFLPQASAEMSSSVCIPQEFWRHRQLIIWPGSPLISVPMLISAASFTFSSTSSGSTLLRSLDLAFSLVPINSTVLTKARLSVMIFPNSGKCQPYLKRRH